MGNTTENEFRLQQRPLPKYMKMEVWKNFSFFDKSLTINVKDLFLTSKEIADEVLVKVVKGL